MIDLKFLRDFPDRVRKALLDKGIKLDLDRVLLLDLQYREMERELIAIREERNQLTAEIKTEGGAPNPEQLKRGREIAATLAEQKKAVFECRKQLDELLSCTASIGWRRLVKLTNLRRRETLRTRTSVSLIGIARH